MLQLSHFKLLAGVFFALFILSACGGSDSAAPATAAATTDTTDDSDSGGGRAACTDAQFDNGTDCVAKVTSCADSTHIIIAVRNACEVDNYTPKILADFNTGTEYTNSINALGAINAAHAYVNIEALIDADNNFGNVTQGGAGQIVSIASSYGFNTTHQEFGTDGAAFDSIYDANLNETYTHDISTSSSGKIITDNNQYALNNNPVTGGGGNCNIAQCDGTRYASLIAGRKDATGMHGIAYNAKIKGILVNFLDETQRINTIENGVGADIIAMNHVWSVDTELACYVDGGTHRTYYRPKGANRLQNNYINVGSDSDKTNDTCTGGTVKNDKLSDAELTAWTEAVNPDATNNTIMVFSAGNNGLNSETGWLSLYGADGTGGGPGASAVTVLGDPLAANIPNFRAAYPALYTESGTDGDFTSDRWLVVTGLHTSGVIYGFSNGCGVAMHFCLAAPARNLDMANIDGMVNNTYQTDTGTDYASSTVAGALAVLKGAFPQATPEQLTRLVLETSTYIALDGALKTGQDTLTDGQTEDEQYRVEVTNLDGTKRFINPVYGYGRLSLQEATKPSLTASYVTASNNTSIGALWQDTKLTLSSHFGSNFESVKFGIGDAYGRHFITNAPQTNYAPVAVSLDDYIGNMLADNVQSQTLGGQAKLNYSNNAQPWMNLEYASGKATSKIAFQDSYKIKPLNDTSATSILRANNIRPASHNIGMMDVDYALNGNLSLSSYAARGEYDTGYKFDELGTDFDVNYKKSHLNIAIGNIREHDQFLGTHTTGGYALNAPTVSRFTDVTYGHDVGNRFNIYANYINYETDVDMLHDQFASIDGLQADQYQVGFTGKNLMSDDDNLNVALITKLGVTDGALNQNTTLGYTADGAFNDVSQSYDLAVSERHQQFEITYQGKIYQNSQDGVSVLKDNRFFTTIRVDQNLNHVQGVGQTEIVSGVSARF